MLDLSDIDCLKRMHLVIATNYWSCKGNRRYRMILDIYIDIDYSGHVKVTGHSKIKFFVGFSTSVQDCCLVYNMNP